MKQSLIVLLSLLFHFDSIYNHIQANDEILCDEETGIYLFDYEHFIWQEYSLMIRYATCDINYFWAEIANLPIDYEAPNPLIQEYSDFPFTTPSNFSDRTPNGACNVRPETPNIPAYYCLDTKRVVIEEPILFLDYLEWSQNDYGELVIVWSLAHEWGHYIQSQLYSDINEFSELQAECFVGSYLQFAVNNNDITNLDVTIQDWHALMSVTLEQDIEVESTTIGRWANIDFVERGIALNLGYEEGISTCLSDF